MAGPVDVAKIFGSPGFPFRLVSPAKAFHNLCECGMFLGETKNGKLRRKLGQWKFNQTTEKQYPHPLRPHALLDFMAHFQNYAAISNNKAAEHALQGVFPQFDPSYRGPRLVGRDGWVDSEQVAQEHATLLSSRLIDWARLGCSQPEVAREALDVTKRIHNWHMGKRGMDVVKENSPHDELLHCWWAMILFCLTSILKIPADVDRRVPKSVTKNTTYRFLLKSIDFPVAAAAHECGRDHGMPTLCFEQKRVICVGQFPENMALDACITPTIIKFHFECSDKKRWQQFPTFWVSCPLCRELAPVRLTRAEKLVDHLVAKHASFAPVAEQSPPRCHVMCLEIKCTDCGMSLFPLRDGMDIIRSHKCKKIKCTCTLCGMSVQLSPLRHEHLDNYVFQAHDVDKKAASPRCVLFKQLVVLLEQLLSAAEGGGILPRTLVECLSDSKLMDCVNTRCAAIKRAPLETFAWDVLQPLVRAAAAGPPAEKKHKSMISQKEVIHAMGHVCSLQDMGLCGLVAFLALPSSSGVMDQTPMEVSQEAHRIVQRVPISWISAGRSNRHRAISAQDVLELKMENEHLSFIHASERDLFDRLTCSLYKS